MEKQSISNKSWINGTTKEPFVNANMIELRNRFHEQPADKIASYFAKDLLIDWRIGAAYLKPW
jgi:deoxyribodipyrimidine photo-lyase